MKTKDESGKMKDEECKNAFIFHLSSFIFFITTHRFGE